jgi:hypothetical protein
MAKPDIWTRLQNVDARAIYAIIGLVIASFVLQPVVLPLPVSPGTRMLYDFINKLPPDSVVVMSEEHTVGFWPECGPGAVAVWQHAFQRPLKLIFVAFVQDGALMEHTALTTLIDKGNKKYGDDYVQIGFVAGEETGVAAFAKDFTMSKSDYYGTPLETLPLLKKARSAKDVALWVVTGSIGNYWVLRQVNAAYGVPQATVTMAAQEAIYLPYLSSGQFVGMLNSVRGGAEYENLLKRPGFGNQMMGALTVGTGAIFCLVIFGNIVYWMGRRRRK